MSKIPGEFVPLDVRYRRDRAIRSAGIYAELLYVRALAHAKGIETDGVIEDYDLPDLTAGIPDPDAAVTALVRFGLWVETSQYSWLIRSFDKWNPGKSPSASGTLGNHNRWHRDRGMTVSDCPHCPTDVAPGSGNASPPNRPDVAPDSGTESQSREEKTREEKKRERESPPAAKPKTQGGSGPDKPDPQPEVIEGEIVQTRTIAPEQQATDDAYQLTGKAFNFIAVRQLAKWLIHERGLTPEDTTRAIVLIYQAGKPITKQTLGQLVDGHIDMKGNRTRTKPTTGQRINNTQSLAAQLHAEMNQEELSS